MQNNIKQEIGCFTADFRDNRIIVGTELEKQGWIEGEHTPKFTKPAKKKLSL